MKRTMDHSISTDLGHHPRHSEVFLSQKPITFKEEGRRKVQGGVIERHAMTMPDGIRHYVLSGEPDRRSTDVPMMLTSAWTTGPGGIHERMMRRLLKDGVPFDWVSIEQNLRRAPKLARAAHNQLAISDITSAMYDRDPVRRSASGISRGSLVALMEKRFEEEHGLKVVYINPVVPVVPHKSTVLNEAKAVVRKGRAELSSLALIRTVPFGAAVHYPRTLDTSFRGIVQNIKAAPGFLTGEVGEAARDLPVDVHGDVTINAEDCFNQDASLIDMLAMYPNLNVAVNPGLGHLAIVGEAGYQTWRSQVEAATERDYVAPSLARTALRAV